MHTVQHIEIAGTQDRQKRFDEIGWGIFFVMIGMIWLFPSLPQGTWLISTGALLLVLNAIRYKSWAEWSGFSTALGLLALAAGVSELMGVKLPIFAICLIAIGASMLLKSLYPKAHHEGGEQSR